MCRLGYKLDASARRSVVARFLTHSRPCVFPLSLSLLLAVWLRCAISSTVCNARRLGREGEAGHRKRQEFTVESLNFAWYCYLENIGRNHAHYCSSLKRASWDFCYFMWNISATWLARIKRHLAYNIDFCELSLQTKLTLPVTGMYILLYCKPLNTMLTNAGQWLHISKTNNATNCSNVLIRSSKILFRYVQTKQRNYVLLICLIKPFELAKKRIGKQQSRR